MSARALIAGVIALAVGCGATDVGARPLARPSLQLVTLSPMSVHGTGFVARERVRVRLRSLGTTSTRRVRATRRGGFSVSFASVRIDRCSAFSVTAVGRSGRRAAVRRRVGAKCPAA